MAAPNELQMQEYIYSKIDLDHVTFRFGLRKRYRFNRVRKENEGRWAALIACFIFMGDFPQVE